MSIEVNGSSYVCKKCGLAYNRMKGYFPVSYSYLYKGSGYLPFCRSCIDSMYEDYLEKSQDPKAAVKQMCRKLDLYWNEAVFNSVKNKATAHSMMTLYISKTNNTKYIGKSYDDYLLENGALWTSIQTPDNNNIERTNDINIEDADTDDTYEDITDEVKTFWGTGYSPSMYRELERRKQYWMSEFPDGYEPDVGTNALIRQICALELDINRDRAAGKPVDKNINTLNTLLGSACLKPVQQKVEDISGATESTPMGVWIYRYENLRPLPEVDESLKDVNGIKKYVFTWMGHVCKMLGIKNTYTKLYEEEIDRLRVEKPEYSEDDDETLINESYSQSTDE